MVPFTPPTFKLEAFHCPHCNAYATHHWTSVIYVTDGGRGTLTDENMWRVACRHCSNLMIWYKGEMVYPDTTGVPLPNPDLPEDIKADYREAASILSKSPRGSAALLRLAIQKLCIHLGGKGKSIDDDIKALVKAVLPEEIQQALDIVRVVGNEAVHPGQIDLNDDRELAVSLFGLVNYIAEDRISRPNRVSALYAGLPQSRLDAIARRDGKGAT
jgi:hypothetical protein